MTVFYTVFSAGYIIYILSCQVQPYFLNVIVDVANLALAVGEPVSERLEARHSVVFDVLGVNLSSALFVAVDGDVSTI